MLQEIMIWKGYNGIWKIRRHPAGFESMRK
ncbi:unnamed protein product [Nezara viridula]|uniref:Uncharacterized protein n=1 Tax=Nezara viridula TaxID=85310 RepID=A0A9P0E6W6_NEZVI|nr:unnamed protein product [Nezara viridula]